MITALSPARVAGRVSFARNPAHRPVLHLCEGSRLVCSRMADAELEQLEGGIFVRNFAFTAEDAKLDRFSPETISLVVAETGERLVEPGGWSKEITVEELLHRGSRPRPGQGRTFEDALAFGYCAQEVVWLLFTDYLGRGCDPDSMQNWEHALHTRSSVNDVIETLIQSSEYAERQVGIGSLPGRLFDDDLLYMTDRTRMTELQDVSYTLPIRGLVNLASLTSCAIETFIDASFHALLRRPADDGAIRHLKRMYDEDGWSRARIAASLLCAPEFDRTIAVAGFHVLTDLSAPHVDIDR